MEFTNLANDAKASAYNIHYFNAICITKCSFKIPIESKNLTMKKIYLIILTSLISFTIQAQVYSFDWAKSVGGNAYEFANSMTTDASGNVYTTGYFGFTVDFDPGPATFNLTSANPGLASAFIQKLDSNGNFLWAKVLDGATSEARGIAITIDPSGNVIVTGEYNFTADFDPGPATHNLSTNGGTDAFVVKLDASGNFMWAHSFGGGNMDEGRAVTTDPSGNIYLTGVYATTVDFDPGAGTFNMSSISSEDIYLLKLDGSGNFVFAKSIGGSSLSAGNSIGLDVSGNIYTTGSFAGTVDFDPGVATFNLTSNGARDIFVQKLDAAGNFVWAKSTGGSSNEYSKAIVVDAFGNTHVTGTFAGMADFDPGSGTFNLTSNGGEDFFTLKLDNSGNFEWASATGGAVGIVEESSSIALDDSGNTYMTGRYMGTVDFDPGTGVFNLSSSVNGSVFIQKLAKNGNFVWATAFSGGGAHGFDIALDLSNNILVTGVFAGTQDFDPSLLNTFNLTAVGSDDFFIQKLNQQGCAILPLSVDSVFNIACSNDSGYAYTHAQHGTPPYTYSWNTTPPILDSVGAFNLPGIYTVTATDANNCALSTSLFISGPSNKTGFDLNANLVAPEFRTGFPTTVRLDAFNDGCVNTTGQLSLIFDSSLMTYDSASITPDQINSDTLVWDFINLTYDSAHIQPQVFLTTKTTAAIGDTACFELIMTPITGDVNITNNTKYYCFQILNAYDPNDKQVYPQGSCTEKYVLKNEPLTYTIRFQNTGNADAINVHIIDSINANLDINTTTVLGNSHPMHVEVLDGNVLDFVFNNIHLPDSTSNEPASHGYVIFEITPKTGLSDGAIVENTSEIYFDFNPAVVTNTVSNTLIDVIPVSTGTAVISSCNSYTWIDGVTYTENNNTAMHRIIGGSANLCDSLVSLDLTINTVDVGVTTTDAKITANENGATYQWLDCNDNNSPIAGETAQSFTASANGDYAVEVTKDGCSDISACVSITSIGIADNSLLEQVAVYPNPTKGQVTVDLNQLKNATIKVFNASGQLVYEQQNINVGRYQFEFTEAPGIYTVEVSGQDAKRQFKLMKK